MRLKMRLRMRMRLRYYYYMDKTVLSLKFAHQGIVKIKKIFDRLGYSQTSISDFRSDIGDSEYFLSFIILKDVC